MEDKKYIHAKYLFGYKNSNDITSLRAGSISINKSDIRSISISEWEENFTCFITFNTSGDGMNLALEMSGDAVVLSEDWMRESFKEELKRVAYSLMEQLG